MKPIARPSTPMVILHSVRAPSLLIAALPVLVALAAVNAERHADLPIAICCLAIVVLIQAGTNALNDAEDAYTGADVASPANPSLSMQQGWVTPRSARAIAVACFILVA